VRFPRVGDRCSCGEPDLRRYRRRLSGPLLDRVDLLVTVERPEEADLGAAPETDSSRARARVAEARRRQESRLAGTGARCNGEMDSAVVRSLVRLEEDAAQTLGRAYALGALSARGRHRVVRVAQTLADLDGRVRVTRADVLTALSLRQRTGHEQPLAA
jgi:magnesium chelatase family protein